MTDSWSPDFGTPAVDVPAADETTEQANVEQAETPKKEKPARKPARKPAPVRRRASGSPVDRRVVERVLEKRHDVEDADPDTLKLASQLLGCADDLDALTVAFLSGNLDEKTVTKLDEVRQASEGEASIAVFAMGSAKKGLWDLIGSLGGKTGTLPSSDIKAAVAIVEAAKALDSSAVDGIEAVRDLIG